MRPRGIRGREPAARSARHRATGRLRAPRGIVGASMLLGVTGLVAAPFLAPGSALADGPSNAVAGQAQAVFARLVPYLGLPGVATSLGITTAQVGSGTAQASAGVADFGLIGAIANANAGDGGGKGPAFALPEPVIADSQGTQHVEGDPFAPPGSAAAAASSPVSGAHQSASATRDPLAAVGTATGPSLNLPGVLAVTGGSSTSKVDNGISSAEVTISQIILAGGQVQLRGLIWTTTQQVGKPAVTQFNLGSMVVNGAPLPVADAGQLAAAIEAANKALEPVGVTLEAPKSNSDASGGGIAPLILGFRNPQSLVDPTARVSGALKPAVVALTQQIVATYPDASAVQLVGNAVLGAAGGRSGGRLELGGVSARLQPGDQADGEPATDGQSPRPLPSLPVLPLPAGPAPSAIAPATAPAGTERATGGDQVVAANAGTPPQVAARPVSYHVPHTDDRDVAVLAVGLGLLVLVGLALVDRLRAG